LFDKVQYSNEKWFENISEARLMIEACRMDYNMERPQQGLVEILWKPETYIKNVLNSRKENSDNYQTMI